MFRQTQLGDNNRRRFNDIVSSARQVVERSFGLLKGRWRRLRLIEAEDMERVVKIVYCCCILHNFCIDLQDHLPEEEIIFDEDEDEQLINMEYNARDGNRGNDKRNLLVQQINTPVQY